MGQLAFFRRQDEQNPLPQTPFLEREVSQLSEIATYYELASSTKRRFAGLSKREQLGTLAFRTISTSWPRSAMPEWAGRKVRFISPFFILLDLLPVFDAQAAFMLQDQKKYIARICRANGWTEKITSSEG